MPHITTATYVPLPSLYGIHDCYLLLLIIKSLKKGELSQQGPGAENPDRVLWRLECPSMGGRHPLLLCNTAGIPQDPLCWPEVTPCVTFLLCHTPGMSALT